MNENECECGYKKKENASEDISGACCPGTDKTVIPQKDEYWITGSAEPRIGKISRVSTDFTNRDRWNAFKSRISNFRSSYSVEPGIYAVGNPTTESDIFVSANYKLSFDHLRRSLKGIDAWILVLNTKGINVWCAAGKGTFGTEELIGKISEMNIASLVSHKKIIIPQLGAPGVNASLVQKQTGFRVLFGPVLAKDINEYIARNYSSTEEMRRIRFSLSDRIILTPMEIIPVFKWFLLIAIAAFLFFSIDRTGFSFDRFFNRGIYFTAVLFTSVIAGSVLGPALLPVLPGRSFAVKGFILGAAAAVLLLETGILPFGRSYLYFASYLILPAFSSFLLLQFTGASTFTGISGVRKELRLGVPVYIILTLCSVILLGIFKFSEWRGQ